MDQRPPGRLRMLLTAAGTAVGAGLAWWRWGGPWLGALAIVAVALTGVAALAPALYAPVFRVLDGLVRGLLQAVTWVLLGAVFAVVFVPGRLVAMLRRRDPLERRADPSRSTYWSERTRRADEARRFTRQF